jgi:hypothetical protein
MTPDDAITGGVTIQKCFYDRLIKSFMSFMENPHKEKNG